MIKIQKILFVFYFLVNIMFNWPHGSSHLLEFYGITRNDLDISIYNLQSFMRDNEIITRPPNFNKENSGSFGQETVDLFSGNFNKIKECGTEKIHYIDVKKFKFTREGRFNRVKIMFKRYCNPLSTSPIFQ